MTATGRMLLEVLEERGELSAANLGEFIRPSGAMNSNPGTLAASSALRKLEREGMVRRRTVQGSGYFRTLWRLA